MSAIDDLPPLRDVIARYELRAIKAFGQNFLLDLNLTARIARACVRSFHSVFEIAHASNGSTRMPCISAA